MSNHLKHQTSPYLLQHAENPVDWYPWCTEAFEKAKAEDKPIFLSIGYSTCHWCHVMAHESFENAEIAEFLNQHFISIKVDKEERPDIDSIYMSVCQAFTGSGGWPTSIFMTPEQKPFFAGTYFPPTARYGAIGFKELLSAIDENWKNARPKLLQSADHVMDALKQPVTAQVNTNPNLLELAINFYKSSFDKNFGGFGEAPKFPSAHNLLFLLSYYEKNGDQDALRMAETTLLKMYAGGLFDHIGYGFCRYSTDQYFLVPHFEKMLYDNALLILAYCKTYWIVKDPFYLDVAEKTAAYILREMTSPDGGFYSAQDADSEGEEGKYYVFEPSEIITLLGHDTGNAFNQYYDITEHGNFEGKSNPNLLQNHTYSKEFDSYLPKIYDYRRKRNKLHLDDKILTSWNSLMISAMCQLYRISRNKTYLDAATRAHQYIEQNLCENGTLFVSFRVGKRSQAGFLDDYANYIFALLSLYDATLDQTYLDKAQQFCRKSISDFYDEKLGGFYLYGKEHEQLILRPKDTYDGAMPSGNSVMAYNLLRLFSLSADKNMENILKHQLDFMGAEAAHYPTGYSMFLIALSDYMIPPQMITVVLNGQTALTELPFLVSPETVVRILNHPTKEYPLMNGKITFYVCHDHHCMPPVNDLNDIE